MCENASKKKKTKIFLFDYLYVKNVWTLKCTRVWIVKRLDNGRGIRADQIPLFFFEHNFKCRLFARLFAVSINNLCYSFLVLNFFLMPLYLYKPIKYNVYPLLRYKKKKNQQYCICNVNITRNRFTRQGSQRRYIILSYVWK